METFRLKFPLVYHVICTVYVVTPKGYLAKGKNIALTSEGLPPLLLTSRVVHVVRHSAERSCISKAL